MEYLCNPKELCMDTLKTIIILVILVVISFTVLPMFDAFVVR